MSIDISVLNSVFDQVKLKIDSMNAQLIESHKQKKKRIQEENEKADIEIEDLFQEECDNLKFVIEQQKDDIQYLERRLKNKNQNIVNSTNSSNTKNTTIKLLLKSLDEANQNIGYYQKLCDDKINGTIVVDKKHNLKEKDDEIEHITCMIEQKNKEFDFIQSRIDEKQNENSILEKNIDTQIKDNETLAGTLEKEQEKITKIREKINKKRSENVELQKQILELRKTLADLKAQTKEKDKK